MSRPGPSLCAVVCAVAAWTAPLAAQKIDPDRYFLRLEAGDQTAAKKSVVLR